MRRRLKWLLSKWHGLSDARFLRAAYRLETGRRLNLEAPETFDDKLNWLKVYGRTGRLSPLVDKLAVRGFVARVIGEEYLVPLIGVYSRARHIAWHELPDAFAVKCTHGSHCGIVCRDKRALDTAGATKRLDKWMKRNWYWFGRESPYWAVAPRVIVEALVADEPTDYKIMCFSGEPEVVQVHGDRSIDFFTAFGRWLPWRKAGYANGIHKAIDWRKLKAMLPVARALAR